VSYTGLPVLHIKKKHVRVNRDVSFRGCVAHAYVTPDLAPSDCHVCVTTRSLAGTMIIPVMMEFRTRCLRGFDHNRIHSSKMGSKVLRTSVHNALKKG